ncbi:MAG: M23 family metallopeptidase [Clostridia bacterium]|nr:M23 family metallopeptidase [Clostridia bacterium]
MKKSKTSSALRFIRANAVYFVLGLCILAVGLSITFMLMQKGDNLTLENEQKPSIDKPSDSVITPPEEDLNPVQKPIMFILPVETPTSIGEYGDTMVYNSTLGRFTAHLAIDFFAPEGSDVLAVYDGTILSVETTFLQGTTVTIDHGNGLYSIYNSLADGDSVAVGQVVKQGDVIGQVSTSNRQEYKDGAHVHFSVKEGGELINPEKYLAFEEK